MEKNSLLFFPSICILKFLSPPLNLHTLEDMYWGYNFNNFLYYYSMQIYHRQSEANKEFCPTPK